MCTVALVGQNKKGESNKGRENQMEMEKSQKEDIYLLVFWKFLEILGLVKRVDVIMISVSSVLDVWRLSLKWTFHDFGA